MNGGEAGLEVATPFGLGARATAFRSDLINPITNVTTGANTRQRQNLGRARIQGLEANIGYRLAPRWLFTANYTLADGKVTEAPGQPQLIGKQLAQDAKSRASFTAAYHDPRRFTVEVLVRYSSRQFEDDQNLLPLPEVTLVDLFASWHLTAAIDVFVAVDNLFDRQYLVGRAGVDTIGQPRFVHGGIRLRSGN